VKRTWSGLRDRCPTQAIVAGEWTMPPAKQPHRRTQQVSVRKPEKNTQPSFTYVALKTIALPRALREEHVCVAEQRD